MAIFGSEANVANGRCIGNSANFNQQSTCPTTAAKDFKFTEGPVPAAGASVSKLQAEAGAVMSGERSATVNVIDETPAGVQKVVMTCTVAGGNKTCVNAGTAAVVAGDYLMVRIDTTGPGTFWRVTFRY